MENVPPFLANALPQFGATPNLQTVAIRGNVNTRLGFLHLPGQDERRIDGVVLAFAGLQRLWSDTDGRAALTELLRGLRWMILPLRECPAAPAQGALAIECRADDAATLQLLAKLDSSRTRHAVQQERQILADWGGGCHQRFGATVQSHDELEEILYIRGRKPGDDKLTATLAWKAPDRQIRGPHWDGSKWRKTSFRTRYFRDLPTPPWLAEKGALFISHSRALPADWNQGLRDGSQRVWTSGLRSWLRLAARGVWVEGCAEELGFENLMPQLEESLLQLPELTHWRILTHDEGAASWPAGQTIATYSVRPSQEIDENHPAVAELRAARSFFWTSGSQYEVFSRWVPADAEHACRVGKTYNYLKTRLREKQIRGLNTYPDVAHWRTTIKD
jgi:hydroxymethylbilane synthase